MTTRYIIEAVPQKNGSYEFIYYQHNKGKESTTDLREKKDWDTDLKIELKLFQKHFEKRIKLGKLEGKNLLAYIDW